MLPIRNRHLFTRVAALARVRNFHGLATVSTASPLCGGLCVVKLASLGMQSDPVINMAERWKWSFVRLDPDLFLAVSLETPELLDRIVVWRPR